ncbi:MAG: biotin transporter BioY [Chlamydiales bacterium]
MTVLVDLIKPKTKNKALLFNILAIVGGSIFLALLSQVAIPLWFTPVPLTMQTFALMLLGAALGSRRGALAVMVYLAEGAVGLPVFANFHGGIEFLAGPTGGYLFAFVLATFIMGFFMERGANQHFGMTLLAFILGNVTILGLGTLWLSLYVGVASAFSMGVLPFIVGDLIKIAAANAIIPSIQKYCVK